METGENMACGYQYRKIGGFSETGFNDLGAEWQSNTQFALGLSGDDDSIKSQIKFPH